MNFFLKTLIKKQLKGMPDEQIDMLLAVIEKNPEFFQKIAQEIKAKTDAGMSNENAAKEIFAIHGEEMKKVFGK